MGGKTCNNPLYSSERQCIAPQDFCGDINNQVQSILEVGNVIPQYKQYFKEIGITKSISDGFILELDTKFGSLGVLRQYMNEDILENIRLGKEENIIFFLEHSKYVLENLKSRENFRKICKNGKIRNFIFLSHIDMLKSIGKMSNGNLIHGLLGISKELENLTRILDASNFINLCKTLNIHSIKQVEDILKEEVQKKPLFENLVKNAKPIILKKILTIYSPKNLEELGFILKNKNILDLLLYSKERNFTLLCDLYDISSQEDFEKNILTNDVVYIIRFGNYLNLDLILDYVHSSSEFSQLISRPFVLKVLEKFNPLNLEFILELCENLEDFLSILNSDILYIGEKAKEINLEFLFSLYKVENTSSFQELLKNKKWEHYKQCVINGDIGEIKKLQDISTGIKINEKISDFHKLKGVCSSNEDYNEDILIGDNSFYSLVLYEKKILGYIKYKDEDTFLSFYDVFDEDGTLVFAKGWIYAIDGAYTSRENLDLQDVQGRNPLRKCRISNLNSLIDYFLETQKKK